VTTGQQETPPRWRFPGSRAFAALSRRVRALIFALLLFAVLFALAITLPVPYVVLSPGPTYNTLGTDPNGNQIIVIEGHKVRETAGHLNMTTVNVSTAPLTAFEALRGWLLRDEVVVPKASVFPPGKSEKQVDAENRADFSQSQDNAVAAASCALGYPRRFGVVTVFGTGPSHGKLQPADVITSVAGTKVSGGDDLLGVLETQRPGRTVPVQIVRQGKATSVDVTLGPPLGGRKGASMGIEIGQVCQAPFTVDLGLGNQIGGPSAGLMFALGIIEKVGPADLTGKRFVAGTGTIDPSGKVGPIGGIQLKMIAARDAGASVFLAPAGNCADVRGAIPKGLQVIKVATLDDALRDLKALQQGTPVPSC
jgi:PDZ domain-containing protein